MSKIEAVSAASIEDIIQSNGTDVTDEQKQEITWLAGLQILRNRFTLGYVAHEAQREYPTDATKKVIQTGLLSAALLSYLEAWGHRDDPYAKPKERWNPYAGSLLEFRWDIARYRSPSLVVSDAFIAQSGIRKELRGRYAPVERRWANHGFIVPLHECERVTIPLTPTIGLYLHRFPNRRRIKADDFNRHTVYSSRDFVAHCPDWETANPRLHEAVAENLALQRMLRQAMPASF